MDYQTLNAKPARDFLVPSNFVTSWDSLPANRKRGAEQYAEGLRVGRESKEIHISQGTTWGASLKSGSHLSAYEGIGYHACTADLLRGFLDSGAVVIVHRGDGPDAGKSIRIK